MAKQRIEEKADEALPTKKRKKKKRLFKGMVVSVILIGLGVGIFFGRQVIAEVVKNIPLLNQIFKTQEVVQTTNESQEVTTLKEAITSCNQQIEALTAQNNTLLAQVDSLKAYETQYNDFVTSKTAWEQEVADQNPELFIQYYEKIAPENAQILYSELKRQQVATKEQKAYAKVIADMDEESAARALCQIVATDPDLIQYIFEAMSSERQAAILSVMDEKVAPQVIKLIAPNVDK